MASCKDCVHADMCRFYTEELAKAKGITLGKDIFEYFSSGDVCDHFKDRSRFIELPCNKINAIVESNIYDEEEVYYDCTVQVLRNSITGETSVGWFRNDEPPVLIGDD